MRSASKCRQTLQCAGATFLPAKDAKDAQTAVSRVLSGGLSATEAIARGLGLKSHVEQRAEREAAQKVGDETVSCPELEAGVDRHHGASEYA